MPYMIVSSGDKHCVHKQNPDGSAGHQLHCYDNDEDAKKYMRALYANSESSIKSFSMAIVKASFDKENQVMRWRSVNSDTGPDVYDESMSSELFDDFVSRIEKDTPVPPPFDSLICEDSWCGGVPYMSIAHYKSGTEKRNVPGEVERVYIDGDTLKSTGYCYNTSIGKRVFDALNRDLYKKKSDGTPEVPPDNRIRISIGFLDLEHKHVLDDGTKVTFSREDAGQICHLCSHGIGRKIYTKGQLVHLALTRVPANPRTLMEVDKAMGDIVTKKDDAKSIIGDDLIDELEEKSMADGVLVVKSDGTGWPQEVEKCYDPNTDSYDQNCIDNIMMGRLPKDPHTMKSDTVSKPESWGNEPSGSYLVVENELDSSTWRFPVKMNGKFDTGLIRTALTELKSADAYKSTALPLAKSILKSLGFDEDGNEILEIIDAPEWEGIMPKVDEVKVEAPFVAPVEAAKSEATAAEKKKEDEKEEEDSETKKSLMSAFAPVAEKVAELQDAGITGKDAEAALQPLLNKIGAEIGRSLNPTTAQAEQSEVLKALAMLNDKLDETNREVAVIKAMARPAASNVDAKAKIPVSRSIKVDKSAPAANTPVKQLSQIQKLARKSTGLTVDE